MKKSTLSLGIAGLLLAVAPQASVSAAHHEVSFEKDILPVMIEKCIECHREAYKDARGRTRKPKSGYRMDTAEHFIAGGYIQEDEGRKAVVPGDAENSMVYHFTTLPLDDDLHMPTKGDDLTAEEQELLKKWINQGANFGDWKSYKYE